MTQTVTFSLRWEEVGEATVLWAGPSIIGVVDQNYDGGWHAYSSSLKGALHKKIHPTHEEARAALLAAVVEAGGVVG